MVENSVRKTLLWLDTILCDAETDPIVIDRYYQRFKQTIKALGHQHLPAELDVVFIVNLSRDKISYLPLITEELRRMPPAIAQGSRVHLYDHPAEGYRVPQKAHIDQVKNPNKQPGRRDRLFGDASAQTDFTQYKAVIRISMDDDDIFFPGHLSQVYEASQRLLIDRPNTVSAAGFYRSYLVHVTGQGVTLDSVNFNKIIPGNKFYVVPENEYKRLQSLSPWSLPETMDVEAVERFKADSIHLALIRNNAPTFAYMRRAQNLSGQSKAGYIETINSQTEFTNESDFLAHTWASPKPPALVEIVDEPLPRIFRMSCTRPASAPSEIHVTTNFPKVFDKDCSIAFYLMHGHDRLDVQWYASQGTASFRSTVSNLTIRAFVRKDGEIIHRAAISSV